MSRASSGRLLSGVLVVELAVILLLSLLSTGWGRGEQDTRARLDQALVRAHDPGVVARVARAYDSGGLAAALAVARTETTGVQQDHDSGHELAHALGRLEYERIGSMAEVLRQCTNQNNGGCYHGAAWAYLRGLPAASSMVPAQACPVIGNSAAEQECWHGLGHGLSEHLRGETLETTIARCAANGSQLASGLCARGVIMERLAFTRETQPERVCGAMQQYQRACYASMPAILDAASPGDWARSTGACLSAPGEHQAVCLQALGSLIGQRAASGAAQSSCRSLVPEGDLRESCVVGVLTSTNVGLDGLLRGCAELRAERIRDFCYGLVGQELEAQAGSAPAARLATCLGLPDARARESCTRALQ